MTTWVSLFAKILIGLSLMRLLKTALGGVLGRVPPCDVAQGYASVATLPVALPAGRFEQPPMLSLSLLQRHVDDVRQRRMTVVDLDIKSLVAQGPHGVEAFLLARTAAAHPNLDFVQLAFCLRLAEAVDDPAERLFDVRKVRDRPTHDNVLD